jgi:hypothetical protein
MDLETTFYGRAYGMDIRIDKHDDGTLSAYEAFPFSGLYLFAMQGDEATILRRFDVSGALREWLER